MTRQEQQARIGELEAMIVKLQIELRDLHRQLREGLDNQPRPGVDWS